MDIKQVKVADLVPYIRNAKKHDKAQIDNVAKSIQEFGIVQPIVVDKDNNIIIGHCRALACKQLNLEEVPVVKLEDLTPEEANKLRLLDNKLNESEWDFDLLAEDIPTLDFSDFDIDWGLPEDPEEEKEIEEDEVPEPPTEPKAKLGDLYILGNHRLVCGDSTDVAVIDRLMDGAKADMVFCDPPYNIASDSKNYASDCSKAMEKLSNSDWDKNFDITEALNSIYTAMSNNVSVYICTSHFLASKIWDWMKEWSEHYSYCVWSKPNPMPSLSKRHWTWNTELICYATRGKHTFNFPKEGHALSTWTINKKNGDTGHPTEKPVEVPAMAISHSSKKDDIVLDLFGGSGSTLIACEQLNRKCYMCELDPHYIDVIIQRYINLKGTDKDVFLLRDGKKIPYSEVE